MDPKAKALQERTHRFFVDVIKYTRTVPAGKESDEIVPQLLASAGSADSNYRACCKARSKKEFIAKVGVAAEEADESLGWLEALRDGKIATGAEMTALIQEADELTAIFVKSHKTAEQNEEARKPSKPDNRRR
jgi:four helix bundle protein